ncbi:HAMP domain-containing sensor histidine kinase [Mucilaginibacter sp. dw_454]|uniref:sensor histidine kinase n=1 Tax=Mucilaginibacter sp. dw_454 TaxID=2720079 RepID=UPI001BD610F9|nr:HAMP domain-containing sensor histidine kinase [Mucilaginibacter sp. dw_454]
MKLTRRYNRATLIITVIVLLIAGTAYYTFINYIVNKQLDHDLMEELTEIRDFVKTNQRLPLPLDFEGDQTAFTLTNEPVAGINFYDTPYHKKRNNKTEPGRAVQTSITLRGKSYLAEVAISKEASENITQLVIGITILLTAFLLVILSLTNRYVFSGIWQPFYSILQQLKAFNVADTNNIKSYDTNIDEFKELNDAVSVMSTRVKTDYQNLKAFTENASHEMLTPIAVITSKLDTLIQDEQLKADQFAQINGIYTAANKLSRLNQSLLLLVKIDNDLIDDKSTFNIKEVILEKEHQLQELAQSKGIELIDLLEDKPITASRYLIEILVNNLFNNAIKHNLPQGKLYIRLTQRALTFQNSGAVKLNDQEIFERFKRGANSDGTGLGLTIAKNICTQYGYKLTYNFEDNMHLFSVMF